MFGSPGYCPECGRKFTTKDVNFGVCSGCGSYTLRDKDSPEPLVVKLESHIEKVEKVTHLPHNRSVD